MAYGYLKDRRWKRLLGWMDKTLSSGGKEAIPTYLFLGNLQATVRVVRSHYNYCSEVLVGV
jgi:hypothetical protein